MKEARHVASGKIVKASQTNYEDFYGIFECPECKASLSLRTGYTRNDGIYIEPTFVHPYAKNKEEKNCSLRNDLAFGDKELIVSANLSRAQFRKLLRENLLYLLKEYSNWSSYEYCNKFISQEKNPLSVSKIQEIRKFFIELCSDVIKNSKKLFLLKQPKKTLRNKIIQKYQNKDQLNLDKIEEHINKVHWMIDFLINESNNTLGKLYIWDSIREASVDYILGRLLQFDLKITNINKETNPKFLENIIDKYIIQFSTNFVDINELKQLDYYLFGFSIETLYLVKIYILYNQNSIYLTQEDIENYNKLLVYEEYYQKQVKYFSNCLFDWIINYFTNLDFNKLLESSSQIKSSQKNNKKYQIISNDFGYKDNKNILDDYQFSIKSNNRVYHIEVTASNILLNSELIGKITANNKDITKWFPTNQCYSEISKKLNQKNKKVTDLNFQKNDLGNRIALSNNLVVAIERIETRFSVDFYIFEEQKLQLPFNILDGIEKQLKKYCRLQNNSKGIQYYYDEKSIKDLENIITKKCLKINELFSQKDDEFGILTMITINKEMIYYFEKHFSSPKYAKNFLFAFTENDCKEFISVIHNITGYDIRQGKFIENIAAKT